MDAGLRIVAVAVLALRAAQAHAQIPILLEGIGDGEFWSTTPHSEFAHAQQRHGSGLGRVSLWGAVEPLPGLVFFGSGQAEFGAARDWTRIAWRSTRNSTACGMSCRPCS